MRWNDVHEADRRHVLRVLLGEAKMHRDGIRLLNAARRPRRAHADHSQWNKNRAQVAEAFEAAAAALLEEFPGV